MNATRVSFCAGRRFGILLFLFLSIIRIAKSSEVTFTVTGIVLGGPDTLGIFDVGKAMQHGTPFKLVFTFDDTRGELTFSQPCKNAGSGVMDNETNGSPGMAVLTIGSKSYTFGDPVKGHSGAWRSIRGACETENQLVLMVDDGKQSEISSGVDIRVDPSEGVRFTNDPDWKSALTLSSIKAQNSAFNIFGGYERACYSSLRVDSVVVSGPHAGPKLESRPAPKVTPQLPVPPAPVAHGQAASKIFVLSTLDGTRITSFSSEGRRTGAIDLGMRAATGLATDGTGRIYLSNSGTSDQLMSFMLDGKTVTLNPGGCCSGLALNTAGNLYALAMDDQGNGVVKSFVPKMPNAPIKTGLSLASGMAVDASGKVYVVSKGNNVVKSYDTKGQPTEPTIGGLNAPAAIAIDSVNGRIYVANYTEVATFLLSSRRVPPTIHLDKDGEGVYQPTALAVDASGRLYVGYYAGKVGIYEPDGKPTRPAFDVPSGITGIAVH